LSRKWAALSVGVLIWALGFLTVMSFGPWSDSIFDSLDYLTNNILLPLGGLAIVVFAGWFMARNSTADELDPQAGKLYQFWRLSARYIAPVAIVLVMLNAMGVLPFLIERISG
jgi:NSS family neurotransmitter:Na+ symporter